MHIEYTSRIRLLSGLLALVAIGFSIAAYRSNGSAALLLGIGLIPVCGIAAAIWAMKAKAALDGERP